MTETKVPTLVADGAEDRFNPTFNSRLLAKLLKGAELELYEDAGHAFLFQPDTNYAARVAEFLAKTS